MSEQQSDREAEDDLLVEALALGQTHAAAGRLINRSAKTVQRRLSERDLAARVTARRSEVYNELSGRLLSQAERALAVIAEVMETNPDPYPRLRAATYFITTALRYRASVDQEDRLRALEALVEERLS